ncbi:MAG: peptidylprolyl isomerase [Candidatus Babeliales bacterium]
MSKVKMGDKIKVHYTGKLTDGTIFDSSKNNAPLEFIVGEGKIIKGFEQGVIGMEPGDTKSIIIFAQEAYGNYKQEMVIEVERKQIPVDIALEVGHQLEIQSRDGAQNLPIIVTITKLSDNTVTLDANHPLAGKDLVFDIELVEIL